jgi:hypothetical protein
MSCYRSRHSKVSVRDFLMKPVVCAVLTAMLIVLPMVAATGTPLSISSTGPVVGLGVTHAKFTAVKSAQVWSGVVETPYGRASFVVGDDTITMADGYYYSVRRQVDNDAETVFHIVAGSPSGSHETAVVSIDKKHGTVHPAGVERVRTLLAGSRDFATLVATIPVFAKHLQEGVTTPSSYDDVQCAPDASGYCDSYTPPTCDPTSDYTCVSTCDWTADSNCDPTMTSDGRVIQATATPPPKKPPTNRQIFRCVVAGVGWLGSTMVMIAACDIPEPAQPLACYGSFLLYTAAGAATLDACNP